MQNSIIRVPTRKMGIRCSSTFQNALKYVKNNTILVKFYTPVLPTSSTFALLFTKFLHISVKIQLITYMLTFKFNIYAQKHVVK